MQLCAAMGPQEASELAKLSGEGRGAQRRVLRPGMPFGSHQASQIPGGPWLAFRDQSQAGDPEQSQKWLGLICVRR